MAENANAHPVPSVRRRRRRNAVHVAPMSACLLVKEISIWRGARSSYLLAEIHWSRPVCDIEITGSLQTGTGR